jgi:hypothetical protein
MSAQQGAFFYQPDLSKYDRKKAVYFYGKIYRCRKLNFLCRNIHLSSMFGEMVEDRKVEYE